MAAFDITARATHLMLGLSGARRNAGWQHDGTWLPKVAKKHPTLANLFVPESHGQRLLTVLRLLRNTVHERGFSVGAQVPVVGDHALESMIRIRPEESEELRKAIGAVGDLDRWGLSQPFPNDHHLYLHVGSFVEQLLSVALALLARTVAEMTDRAHTSARNPTAKSWLSQRAVWQLGLKPAVL